MKPMSAQPSLHPSDNPEFEQAPKPPITSKNWRQEAWANFPRDLLAGAIMGGVAHTVVAPVERAKLLLQLQSSNMASGRHQERYNGMWDCIVKTSRKEGLWSLWRGNGSGMLRHYPSTALNFSCKDLYRTLLASGQRSDDMLITAGKNFLAGAAAGCTALIVVYPLDIAHTRLAADMGRSEARQFKGLLHFMNTIYQRGGMKGLYKGLPASLQGMVVHRSVYFGGFDTAKDIMSNKSQNLPFWKRWLAAQAATTSAGLLSYPFDTVRRHMMMQAGLEKQMYASILDCWKRLYETEGIRSFYRGAFTNMCRGAGAALILVLYDEIKHLLERTVPNSLDRSSVRFDEISAFKQPD